MNNSIKTALIGGVSFSVGVAGGTLVTRNILKKKYDALIESEIEQVKEAYDRRYKVGPYETPEAAAEAIKAQDEIIKTANYGESMVDNILSQDPKEKIAAQESIKAADEEREREEAIVGTVNVFDQPDQVLHTLSDKADKEEAAQALERELPSFPNEETPYIITHDEYMDDQFWAVFSKVSLTYFAGDAGEETIGTLMDEKEGFVDNVDTLIGEEHLDWFGYGSVDSDMLYVRNPKMETDFEIARDARGVNDAVFGIASDGSGG